MGVKGDALESIDAARYELNMAAEHQHYVPQLLLRGFLSQIGDEAKKEQVRVFDLDAKKQFSPSITNIMGERRFNDWWIDDDILLSIEQSSSQIESQLAPLIERIRAERRLEVTQENISNLALLVAFQFIRTKKMRLLPERLNQQVIDKIKRMGLDPAKVDGLMDTDKESLKLAHVRQQVKNLGKFTDIMVDKVFFVMTAPEGKNFYLSDHPVALHREKEHLGPMRGLGIGVPYIQIYLPLSADVTLCAYDRAVLGNLQRIRDQSMNEGAREALKALREGRIAPSQMKTVIDGAREYDVISPMLDAIRAGDPVAANADQVDHCNSLQVFHAQRFVVDPAGRFDIVGEMIAEREASLKREKLRSHGTQKHTET